jgi:hypothetical protein
MLILMKTERKIENDTNFTRLYTSILIVLNEFTKFMQLNMWKGWEGYENPSINLNHQLTRIIISIWM